MTFIAFNDIFLQSRSLVQMLLGNESTGMNNPIATTFYLSPIMSIVLFSAFCILEGPFAVLKSPYLASFYGFLSTVSLIMIGATLSFIVIIIEVSIVLDND